MNKIGMHIHELSSQVYGALGFLQPILAVIMDPTPQWIKDVHAATEGRCYIGVRKYEHGVPFWERNPNEWADEVAGMCGDALHLVNGAITYNEPLPAGHDDHSIFPIFDEWQAKMITRLQNIHGVDALAFPFGTGQFTAAPDRVRLDEAFPESCEACRVLSPHDYDWDHLGKSVGWRAMRWLAWLDDIEEAGFGRKRVAVSECGLTQGTYGGPDVGWQTLDDNLLAAVARYMESLRWYNKQLVAVPECVGCATYDWGGTKFGWGTFEHAGISHLIEQIALIDDPAPPPEPPEPPNGGEPVIPERVKIYDFEHGPGDAETRDQAWLESIFGPCINVHPVTEKYQPQPGDVVYQLEWINCKPGTTSCIIEVKDVNGDPVIGETVIFGWPSADPHGYADNGWNWTDNGAPGDTELPDGHVGPNMSVDSYYSPDQGECGAHFIWIWDHPSEMIDGVGMLPFHDLVPGANHLHTEYGFRAVVWGEEPPEPPTDGDLVAAVNRAANALERIADVAEKWKGIPPTPPEPPVDMPFRGQYFNNTILGGTPVLERDDEKIDFDWGEDSPAPEVSSNDFSARWTAQKTFEARTYAFHAVTDDGFRLWVDGQLLIDAWKLQSPTPYHATKAMTAGQHDIKVEYFERGGGAVVKLWWE